MTIHVMSPNQQPKPTPLAAWCERHPSCTALWLASKTGIDPALLSRYRNGRRAIENGNALLIEQATREFDPGDFVKVGDWQELVDRLSVERGRARLYGVAR